MYANKLENVNLSLFVNFDRFYLICDDFNGSITNLNAKIDIYQLTNDTNGYYRALNYFEGTLCNSTLKTEVESLTACFIDLVAALL